MEPGVISGIWARLDTNLLSVCKTSRCPGLTIHPTARPSVHPSVQEFFHSVVWHKYNLWQPFKPYAQFAHTVKRLCPSIHLSVGHAFILLSTQHCTGGASRWCTKLVHKAQRTKHKAQSTKHKAQSTKHKAQSTNIKAKWRIRVC